MRPGIYRECLIDGSSKFNLDDWQEIIVPLMIQAFKAGNTSDSLDWIDQLVKAFIQDIQGEVNHHFIKNLNYILYKKFQEGQRSP